MSDLHHQHTDGLTELVCQTWLPATGVEIGWSQYGWTYGTMKQNSDVKNGMLLNPAVLTT